MSKNGDIRAFFDRPTTLRDRRPNATVDEDGSAIALARPTTQLRQDVDNAETCRPSVRLPGEERALSDAQPAKRKPEPSLYPTRRKAAKLEVHRVAEGLPNSSRLAGFCSQGLSDDDAPASSPLSSIASTPSWARPVMSSKGISSINRNRNIDANEAFLAPVSSSAMASQSSSRRLVQDGLPVVINSDSDSVGYSDDQLPDVDLVVERRRAASPDRRPSSPRTARPAAARTSRKPRKHTSPPGPDYRASLLGLLKRKDMQRQAEERIAKAEADIEAAGNADEENSPTGFDPKTAVSALAEDSDDQERMMAAMQRADALRVHEEFHLFVNTELNLAEEPFPLGSLPGTGWTSVLEEPASRIQACLTGFVSDMTVYDPPPLEVLEWMANQLMVETRDDLCDAYVSILQAATQHGHRRMETMATLQAFYHVRPLYLIDATFDDESSEPVDITTVGEFTPALPERLSQAVRVVVACAAMATFRVQSKAFRELVLLNADNSMLGSSHLRHIVQAAMAELFDYIDDSQIDELHALLSESILDNDNFSLPVTLQIINSLPSSSRRLHALRRSLAVGCFTPGVHHQSSGDFATASKRIGAILDHISTHRVFTATEQTDYDLLLRLVAVLDIAIDASPRSSLTSSSETIEPDRGISDPTSRAKAAFSQKEEEKLYNRSVDRLTKQLRAIASRIRDSGTSYLHRTEVKSAIEHLTTRVENSVRTRPKARKSLFGAVDGVAMLSAQGRLGSFFTRSAQHEAEMMGENEPREAGHG